MSPLARNALLLIVLGAALAGVAFWIGSGDAEDVDVPPGVDRTGAVDPLRPGPDRPPREDGTSGGPDAGASEVRVPTPGGPDAAAAGTAATVRATGRVLDDASAGLGGAAVRALLHRQAFVTVHEPLGIEGVTDGNGAFALDGLPAGVAVALEVEKDGFARRTVAPIQTPTEGAFAVPPITLGPGLRLTGTVRSESGLRPLGDATVTVAPDRPDAGQMVIRGSGGFSGSTDAGGRFSIPGLDFTHYRIEARAPGHAPAVVRRSFIASRGRREVEVSLTLPAADAALAGVVLADDAPVAGAIVRAVRQGAGADAHAVQTRAAGDGSFTLPGLVRARYDVHAHAPGFHATAPVTASPGEGEVRIVLARNGSLSGRVVAPGGGAPDAYTARVLRVEGTAGAMRAVKQAIPEGAGAFVARDLAPGRYVVEVDSPVAARTVSEAVDVGPGEDVRDVVVPLAAGGVVRGRLVDDAGAPLGRATVLLLPGDFDASSAVAEVVQLKPLFGRRAITTGDGRFELPHVATGVYGVRAIRTDGGGALRMGVAVEDGETTEIGDLEVAAGGRLTGIALGVEGAPLPRARVIAVSTGAGSRQSALTDGTGRFALGPLPSGAYAVSVELGDLWKSLEFTSDTPAEVSPGETVEVTVRVRRR